MSATAAITSLLVLGLLIVGGQWLLGLLGIKSIDLLWPSEEWRFHRDYETRSLLTDEEMIREFFSDSNIDPQIPIRIRRIVGHQFELDFQRLRPFDDFGAIYADLDFVEFFDEIEDAFGIAISNDESSLTKGTIAALSELIQRKLKPVGGSIA
jgi:acyl carrier protein